MLRPISPQRWNRAVRYALAPMTVALALTYRMALDPFLYDASPFMYFFVAIIVSGWLGGLGSALAATVLSMLAVDFYYLPPTSSIAYGNPKEIIQVVSFGVLGSVVSMIVARMQREQRRAEKSANDAQANEIEARRAKEELEQRVYERTAQIRKLALELTQAEQRERKRLALVLHDHLQQLLVGVKYGLGSVSKQAPGALENVTDLLDEAIAESRSLATELSPPILHQAGLVAAMGWLGSWMNQKHGLAVEIEAGDEIEPDAGGVCMLLFQCVRELLFNVVKHSGVQSARITIGRTNDHVQIIVVDQGTGFDPARAQVQDSASGFGLFSIRERLLLVGGKMEIESAPAQGVRVSLVAPLPAPGRPRDQKD